MDFCKFCSYNLKVRTQKNVTYMQERGESMAVEYTVQGQRFKLSWLPFLWSGTVVITQSRTEGQF